MKRDYPALVINWIGANLFFVVLLVIAGLLLGLKDILTLLFSGWPHLYPVSNTDCQTWESVYLYTPWARQVSLGNLFPADPFFSLRQSVFSSSPFLTIWVMGFCLKVICLGNLDHYILFMRAGLPLFSMFFLYLIARRWLDRYFSSILVFLGTVGAAFPFPIFGWGTIGNMPKFISQATVPLEMTKIPYPSLSFVFFALTLWITIHLFSQPLKKKTALLVGMLWGLNIYVYIFNFVFGVVFAGLLVNLLVIMGGTKKSLKNLLVEALVMNSLLLASISAVILPFLFSQFVFIDEIGKEFSMKVGWVGRERGLILSLTWVVFMALTYFATLIVAWLRGVNLRELIDRSKILVLLLVTYLFTVNLHLLLGRFVQPDHFYIRIYMYLQHLNLIPLVLAGCVLPGKKRNYLCLLIKIVLIIGLIGAIFVTILQNIGLYDYQIVRTAPIMKGVESRYLSLSKYARLDETIVSSDLAVNYMIPLEGKNATLFIPGFIARRSSNDLVEKVVMYIKIFDWDENKLLQYMSSNVDLKEVGDKMHKLPNGQVIYDDALFSFLGYWFVYHGDFRGNYEKRAEYRQYLLKVFKEFDLARAARENKVMVIQSDRGINKKLRPYVEAVMDSGKGYKVYRMKYK
ncbi:MAG: hypothetical protein KKC80_05480 [Candidatus Margulisbacteria bacterium]|nr:hypothetical protein [Candidatus Margulisiibacteriota bacterium]MBU1617130.1 hypothetical protein [Candidatus Margulisiibacteriota bacterium]